jgi:hypothetical protein
VHDPVHDLYLNNTVRCMRAPRIILILIVAGVAVAGALIYFSPVGPGSPYRRFHARDSAYYSRLAHACDSVLQQHPQFAKHSQGSGKQLPASMLWMDANDVLWEQVRLSPQDPSLPDAVRALHPDEILLAPRRVFLGFGVGRVGWSIIWEQDEIQTNTCTLQSNAEGLVKKVYAEAR